MSNRRQFLSYIPAAVTMGILGCLDQTKAGVAGEENTSVGAIETIMRGHGLLDRAIIIYDVSRVRLSKEQQIDPSLVLKTADVIHNYLERFHESMEEKYIFASMEKNNVCYQSIQELKIQHGTGYELTRRIMILAKTGKLSPDLTHYLTDFVQMYRHHSAWEDTVIFPAFDAMENRNDLAELSTTFASEERKILGHNGFNHFLNQIADVERELGIYELSSSTPKLGYSQPLNKPT